MDDTLRTNEQFRLMVREAKEVRVNCVFDPDEYTEVHVSKKAILEATRNHSEMWAFTTEDGILIVMSPLSSK